MKVTSLQGIYRDVLIDQHEAVLCDRGWQKNTILDGCRLLLAGFMSNEDSRGIQYLAVGQGDASWDSAGTPAPEAANTNALVDRAYPGIDFSDLEIAFLDTNDELQAGASNRLQITATLRPGFPAPLDSETSYPLREFGLFGRFSGADMMINSIRHPVLHKAQNATLIRVMRLYF